MRTSAVPYSAPRAGALLSPERPATSWSEIPRPSAASSGQVAVEPLHGLFSRLIRPGGYLPPPPAAGSGATYEAAARTKAGPAPLAQPQLVLQAVQQVVLALVDAGTHELRLDLLEPLLQFLLVS